MLCTTSLQIKQQLENPRVNPMRNYNPTEPLISLHIPKCAGQSFRRVLEQFFPGRVYYHYFQMQNALPPKHPLKPAICIHGHFNHTRGFGVMDYYPCVQQLITVLREPLEAAISNYFYWKTKARNLQLSQGKITAGGEHDYKDINDFFRKRSRSNMLDFMPQIMTPANYKEIIETNFVWIGLVENLQHHVNDLSSIIGVSTPTLPRINTSYRDEELSADDKQNFIENNSFEYEIFRYVSDKLLEEEKTKKE